MHSNPIVAAFAAYTNQMTAHHLAYANKERTRADAAIVLFDRVEQTPTPAVYRVPSADGTRSYLVDCAGPGVSCQCRDSERSPHGICKHGLAAAWYHALLGAVQAAQRAASDRWHAAKNEIGEAETIAEAEAIAAAYEEQSSAQRVSVPLRTYLAARTVATPVPAPVPAPVGYGRASRAPLEPELDALIDELYW